MDVSPQAVQEPLPRLMLKFNLESWFFQNVGNILQLWWSLLKLIPGDQALQINLSHRHLKQK
jgi:hypothetical protein